AQIVGRAFPHRPPQREFQHFVGPLEQRRAVRAGGGKGLAHADGLTALSGEEERGRHVPRSCAPGPAPGSTRPWPDPSPSPIRAAELSMAPGLCDALKDRFMAETTLPAQGSRQRAADVQRGTARAAVLGVSDGLVTNVALILGVAAAEA